MSTATAPPPAPLPATDDDLIDAAFRRTLQLAVTAYASGWRDAMAGLPRQPEAGETVDDVCYATGYADQLRRQAGRRDDPPLADGPGTTWAHLARAAYAAELLQPAPLDPPTDAPDWLKRCQEDAA